MKLSDDLILLLTNKYCRWWGIKKLRLATEVHYLFKD